MTSSLAMTNDEAQRYYSSSQWSHRFSAEEVVSKHIQIVTEGRESVLSRFPKHELDVSYGPGEKQKCDIFYPISGSADAPIFVFIHGGMWQSMDRSHYRSIAAGFADAGLQIILAGYDLAPNITMAEMESEMQQLGTFLLDRAHQNGSSGLWFCGHSAGAHLASLLLSYEPVVKSPVFQGLILISGLYDLEPLLNTSYNEALNLTSESAKQISSIDRSVLTGHRKIMIVIAEHDSPAFKQQSKKYYEHLSKESNKLEFVEIKNVDHFNIIELLANPDFELTVKIKELIA